MSSHPHELPSRSAAPLRPQLAAHTERANALAERLLNGKISQKEHDAHIYATTIVSTDRVTSIPIVLTLDDSLIALIAYAHWKFETPIAKAETTKLYVLWSQKVYYAASAHRVPESLVLLEQDTLNMILTFMKASPQVEQLVVQFEKDVVDVVAKTGSTATEANQSEAEDDTLAPKEENSDSPKARGRGSPKGKELSTSRKGKGQERSPGNDRNVRDTVEGHQQNSAMLEKVRIDKAKLKYNQQKLQANRETPMSESSSGASKSVSSVPRKDEKRGNSRNSK